MQEVSAFPEPAGTERICIPVEEQHGRLVKEQPGLGRGCPDNIAGQGDNDPVGTRGFHLRSEVGREHRRTPGRPPIKHLPVGELPVEIIDRKDPEVDGRAGRRGPGPAQDRAGTGDRMIGARIKTVIMQSPLRTCSTRGFLHREAGVGSVVEVVMGSRGGHIAGNCGRA